jgi:predicted CoA-binding protein
MLPTATFKVAYTDGTTAIVGGDDEDVKQSFTTAKELVADDYETLLAALETALNDNLVIGVAKIEVVEL